MGLIQNEPSTVTATLSYILLPTSDGQKPFYRSEIDKITGERTRKQNILVKDYEVNSEIRMNQDIALWDLLASTWRGMKRVVELVD